ncbi:MAG: HlyD family efflux transporter periplasmic adaptor subunit [Pseudomonadota bacterium]
MRFLRQSLIGLFLTALTLALLALAGQMVIGAAQERAARDARTPPARERVFAVAVVRAEQGTETPVLETFGEVRSRRALELRAAAGGRVIELSPRFEDGGEVQAGEVLVRIDPADAQSALDRSRADLADAEAELRDAEATQTLAEDERQAAQDQVDLRDRALARQRDLEARGVGTAAAVEAAELSAASARQSVLSRRQAAQQASARIELARTRLARAEIAVAEAERRLADTTLRAPFDGTLRGANLTLGRLVSINEQLAELIDPADLEVTARISTAQYARLLGEAGGLRALPVTATLDVAAVDLTAQGTLTRASADAGAGQTGRAVFVQLQRPRGFKPGDFVTLAIQEPPVTDVVRLPASALGADGQVLVLGAEDRVRALAVTLVRRQGDDILVRGDGLAGRDVVAARTPLLGPGISVRPLRPGPTEVQAPELVELSDERRARLVAFVQGSTRMPAEAKARVLTRLAEPRVPAQMVARLERRMGG